MENKSVIISGKLTGTKTIESGLDALETPDDIEIFLKEFIKKSFDITTENEIIYINDDEDFTEKLSEINEYEDVSIHVNDSFTRLYITTKTKITYILRINKVSINLINSFISNERPVKYALNAFSFVKWCNAKSVDLRNIYDIPTYIKLLTNNVDPFLGVNDYLRKYTDKELIRDEDEYNCILIGNFVYQFGKYLAQFANKFDLSSVCRLINENSYFEANKVNEEDVCKIRFSYINFNENIIETITENLKEFESKAYLRSPLGRIAIKFGDTAEKIMTDICNEDTELTILNQLYNNNIRLALIDENLYEVSCKYKNLSNVIAMVTAVMNDVFYNMFQNEIDIKIDAIAHFGE